MLRSLGGCLLALVASLALVQSADAKPLTVVFDGVEQLEFRLQGSHGYGIWVSSASDSREVSVAALHPRGTGFAMYLVARRKHGERGFEAKLPGLGRIAVEFRRRGKARELPGLPGCEGRPGHKERGVFVGTINFHGERGYTEVTATRARGTITRSFRETCKVESDAGEKAEPEELRPTASLIASEPRAGVAFAATSYDDGPREGAPFVDYWASKFRRGHGLKVIRAVGVELSRPESFAAQHSGRTASARTEPPAPFGGAADFAIAPGGAVSWSGDLRVTFPGTGPIPLAGERFEAQLCVRRRCAGDKLGADEIGSNSVGVAVTGFRRLAAGRYR
ncbi:MAG: hypothetical protein QOE75_279 [Solirubrobacterales bacterium]|jgi:hypothetical protein|nr:hypothetical protein [Solirubrobacterales bacterium]